MWVVFITQLLRLVARLGFRNRFSHISFVAVVTPTDYPKSLRNRCVYFFRGAFMLTRCFFGFFRGYRGFCHRTESYLYLFHLQAPYNYFVESEWPLRVFFLYIFTYCKSVRRNTTEPCICRISVLLPLFGKPLDQMFSVILNSRSILFNLTFVQQDTGFEPLI